MGGAGVQATQIVGNNSANIVIVGFLGPNAANALRALSIEILHFLDKIMTIKEVLNHYVEGKLQEISSPNAPSHYGMGGGRGQRGIHNP